MIDRICKPLRARKDTVYKRNCVLYNPQLPLKRIVYLWRRGVPFNNCLDRLADQLGAELCRGGDARHCRLVHQAGYP